MLVKIYQDDGRRSKHIAESMAKGISKHGDYVNFHNPDHYKGHTDGDVAVFYGLRKNLKTIFNDYINAGKKAMLVDLGYFNRTQNGKLEGYHKVAVNSYHPTGYMMTCEHDDSRLKRLDLDPKPFNKGGEHILLAGMSGKASWANDFLPLEFETKMISSIKTVSKRRIVYRPKPSWKEARPIVNADYSPPTETLKQALKDCWAIVSHHSNVSIDAALEGIPAFVEPEAPASLLGNSNIGSIENPVYPSEDMVNRWLYALSYQQWTPQEMANGDCWNYFKGRGLV